MDFTYPPEAEAFRKEFRSWLDANLPADLAGRGPGRFARDRRRRSSPRLRDVEPHARRRALRRDRVARGVGRPRRGRHGTGRVRRGDAPRQRARHAEPARPLEHRARDHRARHRRAEAHAPPPHAARRRHLVPGLLRAERGLRPRVAAHDRRCATATCWIVNGQKTWNTLGQLANWCELLVRTDPTVPKHKGITLPARRHDAAGRRGAAPRHDHRRAGSSTRSSSPTCASPSTSTLGAVNEGWRVAMTTLAYERGTVAKLHLGTRQKIQRLIDDARRRRRSATAAWPPTTRSCATTSPASTSKASC